MAEKGSADWRAVRKAIEERRKRARHFALLPVRITVADPGTKDQVPFIGTALDLSFEGLRVHSPLSIPVGSRITAVVRFPEHGIEVAAFCQVVRSDDFPSGGFDLGLQVQWKASKTRRLKILS